MNARKWMLGTAAAALVAGFPLAGLPQNGFVTPVAAATDVSVNVDFNLFYDKLDPYGDWVSYESAYVWVPREVNAEWRPYTRGHWVYTRDYGWMWVSDEPFGWATYHYGRWGHADDIGWYWVPAKRWAPAWVAWRKSDRYLAWAPLPPDNGVNVSVDINIDVNRVPRDYWVAVESDRFLERDISRVAVYDTRVIEEAQPAGTVVVQNNTIVNNVVNIQYVEQHTKERVAVRDVRSVDNPEATGKLEGDAVGVFNADIQGDQQTLKPKKTRETREIIDERKTRGGGTQQQPETTGTVPQGATQQQATPPSDQQQTTDTKKKRKLTPEDTTGTVTQPNSEQQATDAKKKKKVTPEDSTGSVTAPAQGEQQQQKPGKHKKKLPQDESGSLQQQPYDQQPAQGTQRKKKLPAEESAGTGAADQPTGSTKPKRQEQPAMQNENQNQNQRKEKPAQKKQKKCDPYAQDCG